MNIDLKGIIKVLSPEKQVTEKLLLKELVLTIDENTEYPQDILIQAINAKIELLKDFKVGDKAIVKCSLKGKGKDGKYFNHLNLWEIQNKNRDAE